MHPKFTPGPWHVVIGDEWTSDIATDTLEQGIWTVATANKRRDEFEANKHLIAAAPELYEAADGAIALKDIWLLHDVAPEHENEAIALYCMLRKLEAAIAKANGEQP